MNYALPGTRVGIAIKGIGSDEIERGDIFATKQFKRYSHIKIKVDTTKLTVVDIQNEHFEVAGIFAHSAVQLNSKNDDILDMTLMKSLPLEIGNKLLLTRKKSPRIFGVGEIIEVG